MDRYVHSANLALGAATGDFVAFVDPRDRLSSNALGAVNHRWNVDRDADVLYSDEDSVDDDGRHHDPISKPIWSPERLLGHDYCGDLLVMDTGLVTRVGGLREGYQGAEHYDLALRVTEAAKHIVSIPEVLYHRTVRDAADSGPDVVSAQRRAAADAVNRRGINGQVVPAGSRFHRVKRSPMHTPPVSIVIPTAGTAANIWGLHIPMVLNMVQSVAHTSTYIELEILVVVDEGIDLALIQRLSEIEGVSLVEYPDEFNFADKCNTGALAASGEILIFANDDMEVRSPDWIESMIGFLEEPDVGAVGPMLLYDNFTIQSAGHTAGPQLWARGAPLPLDGPAELLVSRECVGTTGACLAIRAETFAAIGGFSTDFPLSFNDVDLCFKLASRKQRIIWTPDAQLFHFESRSRDPGVSASEDEMVTRRWGPQLLHDPYLRVSVEPDYQRSAAH
jgi:GT2 family glycosyltransferase